MAEPAPAMPTHPMPFWVADGTLAVITVVGAFVVGDGTSPIGPGMVAWPGATALVLNVIGAASVLTARHRPTIALVMSAILPWLAALADLFNPGLILAAAVAVYHVATRTSRRTNLLVMLAMATNVTIASLLVIPWGLQVPAIIAVGGAAGEATRSRRAWADAVIERAARAERTKESEARRRVAEDRLAIARGLHDTVAHQIAVVNLHAAVATAALRDRPEDAEESLATIRRASRTVLKEIGDLLTTLRDPEATVEPEAGLEALGTVIAEFENDGLDVTRRDEGAARPLPRVTGIVALRVVQEALTNAHKHGSEHRAHLLIDYRESALRLVITNPMDPRHGADDDPWPEAGNGIIGMRERVELVDGSMTAGRIEPGSWQVTASLPIPPPEPDDGADPGTTTDAKESR